MKTMLNTSVQQYNPHGYTFLITRDQPSAACIVAAAHNLKITVIQTEMAGFTAFDDVNDEKVSIDMLTARIHNVLKTARQ